MSRLGRLATYGTCQVSRLVPRPGWYIATSNIEVCQTTYPVNVGSVGGRGEKGARDKVTKKRRGKEGVEYVTPLLVGPGLPVWSGPA